nr:defensin-like protein P322 [Ipomoea batatas]
MAFSSSSSSVRLFATASLLVMLLMASEMGIMAASPRTCESQFNGHCRLPRDDCNIFCKSMGFDNGSCNTSLRNICTCTKPWPCL